MPHEAQRFTHARAMGRDAQSDQLVHLSNLVPSHMRQIHPTIDGVMFLPNADLPCSANTPVMSAAIPSMLGRRLADIVMPRGTFGGTKEDRVRDWLSRYQTHSVLINILPNEEQEIRAANGLTDWVLCSFVFEKYPHTMPRAFKTWAPQNTIVSSTPDGVAVIFRDQNENGLIRLWFSRDVETGHEKWVTSTVKKSDSLLPIKISCSPYAAKRSTQQQLYTINPRVYSIPQLSSVSGGVVISAHHCNTRLKAAAPSDLAQRLKTEALRAAEYGSGRPEKTPAERVRNAVSEYMADWGRGCTPVLLNLMGERELALRQRHQVPSNAAIGSLFAKNPSLLPQIWWDWDHTATTVECDNNEGYIAVFFKHTNGHDLVGVWIKN
ncbi:hypothetical protein G7054_g7979 [Neopestalotiopsis clavispora]|nr:hypothetical protein G7054_g7979 [Neopestalotiopsis clavispora]